MSVSSASTVIAEPTTSTSKPSTSRPPSSYTLKKRPWRPYTTPFESLLAYSYPGSGTSEDPYIIDWIDDDPEDPQRWPGLWKWFTIAVVSFTTLAVALASSAYSGGIRDLVAEFGASTELLTAGISLFVVGFAFGPLFWAPLSEVYGRRLIFIISYFFLTIWLVAVAVSQSVAQILVFRFLAGFFGSSPLSNAGGVISDVLDANQRGLGMALFAAAPFLGPALGPITGGFLGLTSGWRWVSGFLAIFAGVIFFVLIIACSETYAPTLLRRRAAMMSQATGKVYRFRADAKKPLQIGALFKTSLLRPWKFLIYEPIVIILTIYTAVIYGILYLNFAAYPIVFQQIRGWNTGVGGLAFLGILVGTILSIIISVVYIQPQYLKTAKKRGGMATPEDRLPPAIWGGVLIVVGLAGFAATNGPEVHWIAPIIFGAPFGLGTIVMFLSVLGYLVDSYTIYAASVLAANSVLRSLFGAAFPLFTSYMYQRLGIHWAAALPGFIALACIPFTVIFYKYGARIRAKCRYAADAERQMALIIAARKKQAMRAAGDPEKNAGAAAGGAAEGSQVRTEPGQQPPADPSTGVAPVPGASTGYQTANGADPRLARSASRTSRLSRADREELADLHRSSSHNAVPIDPAYRHEHEWTVYEALADRDEVDLDDDERIHLQELHERFDYAKHKEKKRGKAATRVVTGTTTSSTAGSSGSTASAPPAPAPASPVNRFKPVLTAAEEHHEHEHDEAHAHPPAREEDAESIHRPAQPALNEGQFALGKIVQ